MNDWLSVEQHLQGRLEKDIQAFDANRFLSTSPQDLVDYFVNEFRRELPVIDAEGITVEQRETEVDVSYDRSRYFSSPGPHLMLGAEYEFHIPFSGDGALFHVQPTTFMSSGKPRAQVRDGHLVVYIRGLDLQSAQIRSGIDHTIATINQHLSWLGQSTGAWNANLPQRVQTLVDARRRKLMHDRNAVADLGFKMRERPGAAKTYAAPEVRRKVAPTLPHTSSTTWKPEPVLNEALYDHILSVIGNGAVLMERSPSAFQSLGEEALRDHFLFLLNGQFEGQATGETFNKEGKTDLLIRSDNRIGLNRFAVVL